MKNVIKICFVTMLSATVSCSDTNFSASQKTSQKSNSSNASGEVEPQGNDGSESVAGESLPGAGELLEKFTFTKNAAGNLPAEFLFILDNSASMNAVVDRVGQGFQSLLGEGVFPENARIAVMNTLPADPGDLSRLHPAVKTYNGIEREPGFLRLINKSSLDQFKDSLSNRDANDLSIAGCDQGFFTIKDVNADGEPCFLSHLQIAQKRIGAEAGLTAFYQLLLKSEGTSIFREKSLVNVIYVSDTHDPGIDNDDLKAIRPSFETIEKKLTDNELVNGFKIHAIAPDRRCSGIERLHGRSYYAAADASGGEKLDVCEANDYSDFIRNMVKVGSVVERPVFLLRKPVAKVVSVTVNGKEISSYKLEGKLRNRIRLLEYDKDSDLEIAIIYVPKP